MTPEHRISTHPGVILQKEYIEPMGLTQSEMSFHLQIPVEQINEIVQGQRGITPVIAWLLSFALDTTPQFWLRLQLSHDVTSIK